MIKLGCNAMIPDPDNQGQWIDIEHLIEVVFELNLDMIDFQLDKGLRSRAPDYLLHIKTRCHDRGLPIGFLGVGSGLVGAGHDVDGELVAVPLTAEERQQRIQELNDAVDAATVRLAMFPAEIATVTLETQAH